ncbi:MAG: hypothetical protein HKN41_11280 [Ilumatobacter sp.]|nr:hypothetical protein [Ilumatobacter sp.]
MTTETSGGFSPPGRRTGRGDERPSEQSERRADLKFAIAGGVAATVVGGGGMMIVGRASAFEARRLLESVLPTARFAASAYVAGGATILALMLTLITFSITDHRDFHVSHYRRIRDISLLAVAMIVSSVLLLMFLSFPIGEADVDRGWYVWVYYAVVTGGAVSGGIFITVVLMLYYAVRQLIGVGEYGDAAILLTEAAESPGDSAADRE